MTACSNAIEDVQGRWKRQSSNVLILCAVKNGVESFKFTFFEKKVP